MSNPGKLATKPQNGKTADGRQRCEVFSRVVGYLHSVDQWNAGKKAEFHDRKTFVLPDGI